MKNPSSKRWLLFSLVMWILAIGIQSQMDRDRHYYVPAKSKGPIPQVFKESIAIFGGVFLGFREVAAGLLWVRADEYFHSGKYDELVPMFYIVTWLDPHQIDVYSTGAWHLAYNLGDQRLIPEGVKFLNKGIEDNKNIWDLYFQQSYLHYQKIKDYAGGEHYAQEAVKHLGTDGLPAPYYVYNTIAHCMRNNGQIDDMFKQWDDNIHRTWKELEAAIRQKKKPGINQKLDSYEKTYAGQPVSKLITAVLSDPESNELTLTDQELNNKRIGLEIQLRNLNVDILRRDFFRKGAGQPGYEFDFNATPPHWVPSGDHQPHPINTHFDYHVERIGPRKLRITGHLEGADLQNKLEGHRLYTRLDVWLRDKDFAQRYATHADDFLWQKANLTTYHKQVSFPTTDPKPGQISKDFDFVLDFSKDPEDMDHKPQDLFPFKVDQYELTITLDPIEQSEFHQDVYGWKGEGLTDDHYLKVDPRGIRIITKTVTLNRKDVV